MTITLLTFSMFIIVKKMELSFRFLFSNIFELTFDFDNAARQSISHVARFLRSTVCNNFRQRIAIPDGFARSQQTWHIHTHTHKAVIHGFWALHSVHEPQALMPHQRRTFPQVNAPANSHLKYPFNDTVDVHGLVLEYYLTT